MKAVIDAGAAWVMAAAPDRTAPFLAGATDLIAPDLIVAELFNARWKLGRSGTPAPSLMLLEGLLERLRLVPALPYAAAAAALAASIDQPVFDCLYAAVAKTERAQLITANRRFARRLEDQAIAIAVIAI